MPEDLIENRHRYDAASNQLREHIARADALQLIDVAQQQEFCASPQARKQLMRQPHIHHGRLVHDQKINLQRLILLVLAAKIALQAEQTVQRQRIQYPGTLCHAPAGFAGRRSENDAVFGVQNPVDLDDSFQNCRLASAGAARDDGEVSFHRHLNAAALPLCQVQTQLLLDLFQWERHINFRRTFHEYRCRLCRCLDLLHENMRKIQPPAVGNDLIVFCHLLQFLLHLRAPDLHLGKRDRLVEKLQGFCNQGIDLQIQMPMLPRVFQRTDHRAMNTNRVVRIAAGFPDDRIDAPKAKAGYLAEPERAFPQNIRAGRAEVLIDLHCRHRRDLKRRQQLHNIPHGAAFCIASLDLLQLLLRDAADLQQLLRVEFQHVERICAEPLDDTSGCAFSNALEKTR